MTELKDLQSFLFDFKAAMDRLPFEVKARVDSLPFDFKAAMDSLPFEVKARVDSLPFEDKARMETLYSWLQRLLCFYDKASIALTEEELRSVEEEKQLFFNEIFLDEYALRFILKHGIDFFIRLANASTDEEFQSVCEERDHFFNVMYYNTALDKYIQEKKQKSTAA